MYVTLDCVDTWVRNARNGDVCLDTKESMMSVRSSEMIRIGYEVVKKTATGFSDNGGRHQRSHLDSKNERKLCWKSKKRPQVSIPIRRITR